MKFSIRDLLWLTVVVALAVAWWVDHRRQVIKAGEIAVRLRKIEEKWSNPNSDYYWGQVPSGGTNKVPYYLAPLLNPPND